MHIPDGFLGGQALAIGAVGAAVGVGICLRQVRGEERERDLPVAGLAAAFFLVGDAPMVPITVGTQGHLLGGTLAVALLGPWLGALTIAVVCAVQALVLGDGGVASLGLNVVNLALIPAFIGYPLLLLARRLLPNTPNGLSLACAFAAGVSVVLAACLFVSEFALGAVVDIDLHTLAYSTIGAYCVIAVIEGTITALIVRALLQVRPDLVRVAGPLRHAREQAAVAALRREGETAAGAGGAGAGGAGAGGAAGAAAASPRPRGAEAGA
jgi:cobalt/nickel transport system permease protein